MLAAELADLMGRCTSPSFTEQSLLPLGWGTAPSLPAEPKRKEELTRGEEDALSKSLYALYNIELMPYEKSESLCLFALRAGALAHTYETYVKGTNWKQFGKTWDDFLGGKGTSAGTFRFEANGGFTGTHDAPSGETFEDSYKVVACVCRKWWSLLLAAHDIETPANIRGREAGLHQGVHYWLTPSSITKMCKAVQRHGPRVPVEALCALIDGLEDRITALIGTSEPKMTFNAAYLEAGRTFEQDLRQYAAFPRVRDRASDGRTGREAEGEVPSKRQKERERKVAAASARSAGQGSTAAPFESLPGGNPSNPKMCDKKGVRHTKGMKCTMNHSKKT